MWSRDGHVDGNNRRNGVPFSLARVTLESFTYYVSKEGEGGGLVICLLLLTEGGGGVID